MAGLFNLGENFRKFGGKFRVDGIRYFIHTFYLIKRPKKIDSLLDEFTGELTLPHAFPPGIDDVNLDPEGDILFLESLLYDNSSPRPSEEFNLENPTESFSPSPIPVEDSDSLMFLLLPEIETRFTIRGYALKSNLQDFLLLFPP
ncbi:hypothetical protein Tco_0172313 [Tanacetum coccineum]